MAGQLLRVFTFGIAIISLFVSVQSAPTKGSNAQAVARSAQQAQSLNVQFQTLKATDSCQSGDKACLSGGVAVCRNGTWDDSTGKCSKSQQCFALPSTTDAVLVTCTTESSALSAFQAAGVQGGIFGSGSNNNTTTATTTTGSTSKKNNNTTTTTSSSSTTTAQSGSKTSKTNNNSTTTTTTTTTTARNGSKTSKTNSTTIAKAGGSNKGEHTRSTQAQPTKTVTVVVGTQPTTLPPVTRTLTPQEAVNEMLRIMQAGATIVGQPSPTKTAHHKS